MHNTDSDGRFSFPGGSASCLSTRTPSFWFGFMNEQTAVWYPDRLSVAGGICVLQCSASGSPQCNGTVEVCLRCKLSGPNQRARMRPSGSGCRRPEEVRVRRRPDFVPVTRVPTSSSRSLSIHNPSREWWRVDERNPAHTMGPVYLLVALHHAPPPHQSYPWCRLILLPYWRFPERECITVGPKHVGLLRETAGQAQKHTP